MSSRSSALEVVRHRRTGTVLFYKKPRPPFKNDPLVDFPTLPKVEGIIKNLQRTDMKNNVTETKEHRMAVDEHVLFYFGNDYGFQHPLQILNKMISSYKAKSKFSAQEERLSEDVFTLSSLEDMLDEFQQKDLF